MSDSKQDLLVKYESVKDTTRRFGHWSEMDKFVRDLIEHVPAAAAGTKVSSRALAQWQRYSFDSEGTAIHHSFDQLEE